MKYAIVTGSSQGIGKSIAIALLKNGYFVFFTYWKSKVKLDSTFKELGGGYSERYCAVKVDLSKYSCVEILRMEVSKYTSEIDIIVFNAGITDRTPFPEINYEKWVRIQDIFVNIPMFILQKFDKELVNSASILFVGSLMGIIPHSTSLSYGVSKAAVHSLVENLIKFYADRQIRVNAIAPGFVDTEWQLEKPEAIRNSIESKIALKRFGNESEIRDLSLHVLLNSYINGSIYKIDGGYNYR